MVQWHGGVIAMKYWPRFKLPNLDITLIVKQSIPVTALTGDMVIAWYTNWPNQESEGFFVIKDD